MIYGFPLPAGISAKLNDIYGYMLNVCIVYIFTLYTDNSGENPRSPCAARRIFSKDATGKIVFRRGAYFATGIQEFAAFVFLTNCYIFVEREATPGILQKDGHRPCNESLLPSQSFTIALFRMFRARSNTE